MPLTEPNAEPPFDVLRVSHVELGVRDLDASRAFYEDALGMVVTAEDERGMWLRGLEDTCHHALLLRRESPGKCLRIGFRVRTEADLDAVARYFEGRSAEVTEETPRGQGRTLHVHDPFGTPLAFYHRQDAVERHLQRYDRYRGAAVQRLDHVNVFAAELQETYDWLAGELGFRVSEYTETAEDTPRLWAVWLHRKGNVHDIALTNGVGPRLHHVGMWVRGEMDVIHACDVLAASGMGAAIERGPGRHGISNAFFLYLRDPDGHRIELFTGDYRTLDPEFAPIRWDLDDPRRQTLWGHAAPKSWFDEGSQFEGLEPRQPRLPVRPVVAR
ncbi:MAG TPA: 3,4-dihydroxyphenylacetate 2,3-dioxygenase [Trueperaceae bacterium]|nr:3,4-dihydroxyphenylacetate 2,3-dioxygenase [Trueperaceae bacterium]